MILKAWDDLPDALRIPEVKPYYDALAKKKASLVMKRAFDFTAALLALIGLSPVFLALALAIKLDSPGPVFFRQARVTQYGREFRIFKFRTMVVNAEQLGTQVTVHNDQRITRVGRVVRKCRLDELPQLLNCLLNDMSFVGTRPETPRFVRAYTPEMMATLLLPAGLTSLASIRYKDEAQLLTDAENADEMYINELLPCKMKYNLLAIREFSFWREIKLIAATVGVLLGKNQDRRREI